MNHMDIGNSSTHRKPSTAAEKFAETVRVARARRRWSQTELARVAGTTAHRVSKVESGTLDPRLSTVERIAEALGLTVQVVEAA